MVGSDDDGEKQATRERMIEIEPILEVASSTQEGELSCCILDYGRHFWPHEGEGGGGDDGVVADGFLRNFSFLASLHTLLPKQVSACEMLPKETCSA